MTSSPAPNDGRLTFTPASTPQPTLLWLASQIAVPAAPAAVTPQVPVLK